MRRVLASSIVALVFGCSSDLGARDGSVADGSLFDASGPQDASARDASARDASPPDADSRDASAPDAVMATPLFHETFDDLSRFATNGDVRLQDGFIVLHAQGDIGSIPGCMMSTATLTATVVLPPGRYRLQAIYAARLAANVGSHHSITLEGDRHPFEETGVDPAMPRTSTRAASFELDGQGRLDLVLEALSCNDMGLVAGAELFVDELTLLSR
jgi:hypothetical protein